MNDFESKIIEKLSSELSLDRIYRSAEEFLKQEEIKIEDFSDLYGEENIKKDQEYVAEKEAKFIQETSPESERVEKLATIFEAVIHSQAELNDWFGPNAITIKPSRFDDIKNRIDSIAEFQEPERSASYFALAIDATLSPDIRDKFDRIKEEIEHGELAKVKYFVSDYMSIRGELNKIPRVIIGAETKTVEELGELWAKKDNKALEKHPVQFLILKEMLLQCEAFKNYAKKINQPEIAAIYEKSQKIVQEIYDKKQPLTTQEESYDNVLSAIKSNLESF